MWFSKRYSPTAVPAKEPSTSLSKDSTPKIAKVKEADDDNHEYDLMTDAPTFTKPKPKAAPARATFPITKPAVTTTSIANAATPQPEVNHIFYQSREYRKTTERWEVVLDVKELVLLWLFWRFAPNLVEQLMMIAILLLRGRVRSH